VNQEHTQTHQDDDDVDLRPQRTAAAFEDQHALVLQVEGFEGPLDVLLTLARAQKVDLIHISILELVEQYLKFVDAAKDLDIDLAADYIVMAAWLAYLKSRLLLPKEADDEEPSADELALRLQLRLQRLEAMREVGAQLMARDRLGRDVFSRGKPEGVRISKTGSYDVTLYELLKAYADHYQRHSIKELKIVRRPLLSLEEALERLSRLIGSAVNWTQLQDFLPKSIDDKDLRRSTMASMFAASLELAKNGSAHIRQMDVFGPMYIKASDGNRDNET